MGKFLKVDEKIREFVKERKQSAKLKALGMSGATLDTIYRIYFYAIDAFIKGNPNFWHRQAFKYYVIPGIDDKFNKEAKNRCKSIHKACKGEISLEDKYFLENELRPYFVDSLLKQRKKTVEMLPIISDTEITKKIKLRYKESKGEFR